MVYSVVLGKALLQLTTNRIEKKLSAKLSADCNPDIVYLSFNEYSIPHIVFFSFRLYQSTLNQANRGYNTLHWHKIVR